MSNQRKHSGFQCTPPPLFRKVAWQDGQLLQHWHLLCTGAQAVTNCDIYNLYTIFILLSAISATWLRKRTPSAATTSSRGLLNTGWAQPLHFVFKNHCGSLWFAFFMALRALYEARQIWSVVLFLDTVPLWNFPLDHSLMHGHSCWLAIDGTCLSQALVWSQQSC